MSPNDPIYEQARLARDARFDGRFFIGVKTTGIYCRPICPVRQPKSKNIVFYPSAAAAAQAGFRPCLRCRPECAPNSPAWHGTSTTVRRALQLIAEGALADASLPQLAARLGVTDRHLRRLFDQHLGASPSVVAHTQRLHFAKRLLDSTHLKMPEVADAAGFGSTRRLNDQFKKTYGRTPSEIRKASHEPTAGGGTGLQINLPYRTPFDWNSTLAFLGPRATPGVEAVENRCYQRTLTIQGQPARIEIQPSSTPGFLSLTLFGVPTADIFHVTQASRRALDLDAPIDGITAHLCQDRSLADSILRQPGLRVPGAWNGFEMTVRAILGQQVSVKGATTLTGRLAKRYGDKLPVHLRGFSTTLTHVFPTPKRLARARMSDLGITQGRIDAIRCLAQATDRGALTFDCTQDPEPFLRQLQSIKGIGPWTAQYVSMRVLRDPDAFLPSDLGLLRAASGDERLTPRALEQRAESWRPWRAYAALHLWNSDPGSGG